MECNNIFYLLNKFLFGSASKLGYIYLNVFLNYLVKEMIVIYFLKVVELNNFICCCLLKSRMNNFDLVL